MVSTLHTYSYVVHRPRSLLVSAILGLVCLLVSACQNRIPEIPQLSGYPVHTDIMATIFWTGEAAGPDNGYIANDASAWDSHWSKHYGGTDSPEARKRQRNGQWPAAFQPKENPFYVALPYSEFTNDGQVKPNATRVYWYDSAAPPTSHRSILKNRWVAITYRDKTVYVQWQDVGPVESDDVDYVFGDQLPKAEISGIDMSPAAGFYLQFSGRARVSWHFVDDDQVPSGPWLDIVTTRQVSH